MATDKEKSSTIASSDFLIRGTDYLARHPGFKLEGRDAELHNAANVLMRQNNNNLVIYGQSGVGLTSIIMGLQASKEDLNTPFDIVGKRFYFLDIDALFSSGDVGKINEGFQKAISALSRAPDTVLVIEDTKDFLDGVKSNGTSNIINVLMREIRNGKFQAIFEARDESLADLFKSHSDVSEFFTFQEVREPNKEALAAILQNNVKNLEEYHGISVAQSALDSVVSLTTKYPGLTLNTAQPKRSGMILEGALTAYRRKAHTRPVELDALEETLKKVTSDKPTGEWAGKTKDELEVVRLETEAAINEVKAGWEDRQKKIRAVYADQRRGEEEIRALEIKIDEQKEKEDFTKKKREEFRQAADDEGRQRVLESYKARYGDDMPPEDEEKSNTSFTRKLAKGGYDSAAISELKDERNKWEALVKENSSMYAELTKGINDGLLLTDAHVLGEFSRLSGVPMDKLEQDESQKLIDLPNTLKQRVFGQDEPVDALAKAVKRGRTGLKKPNKPIGSFLFIGPSGVGKTELAKALASSLFGDESALKVYNMSEYAEKHASAVLIGAPPGYEGYAEGGVLTNAMRRQPYCVNVFDEAEKADKLVFDLFLQIIDEGVLTDRRGVPASFANSINILTSNIGAKHFLDETLSFDEAKGKALKELWDPEIGGFRPEFLNRFTGIFCFNRLGLPQIELIAGKSLKELNSWVAENGISIEMPQADLKEMCKDKYVPKGGGRSISNYIEGTVTSDVADTVLRNPGKSGVVKVAYDKDKHEVVTAFAVKEEAKPSAQSPANENVTATAAAKASFGRQP